MLICFPIPILAIWFVVRPADSRKSSFLIFRFLMYSRAVDRLCACIALPFSLCRGSRVHCIKILTNSQYFLINRQFRLDCAFPFFVFYICQFASKFNFYQVYLIKARKLP